MLTSLVMLLSDNSPKIRDNYTMKNKNIVIFGGTGFVGSEIAHQAAELGYQVTIVTRQHTPPEKGPNAHLYQYKICEYDRMDNLEAVLEGAYAAVNCIGILYESKPGDFDKVHFALPHNIAKVAAQHGVQKMVQVSSLGVHAPSEYGKSKLRGEQAISQHFPQATMLRPSVIFGPDDSFFNMFNKLSKWLPVLPLVGGGHTKMQPVFVGDVAKAAVQALSDPATQGAIYELGGPEKLSFKEIYKRLFKHTGRKRILLPLPWWASYAQAYVFGLMPKPLLTVDQVKSLTVDNVVTGETKTLKDLGLRPTPLDDVLPQYLR